MKKRNRVSSRRRIAALKTPGNAADYFTHDGIQPCDKVVLACRKSGRESTSRLKRQVDHGHQELLNRGATITAVVEWEGPGWEPAWLEIVVATAKRTGATKIVFECVNRALRSHYYHSENNFDAQPNEIQIEELGETTQGFELITLLAPNATPAEERSYQTRRGQRQSGNKGGRSKKRKRTIWPDATLRKAIKLREAGRSLGEIANTLGVPRSTVQGWV